MTAFTRTDIPATITTVEELAVWLGSLLNYLNSQMTSVEGTNSRDAVTVRSVQFSPFYVTADQFDFHWRTITRQSIRLNNDWQTGAQKIWTYAQEMSTTPIPASFKS